MTPSATPPKLITLILLTALATLSLNMFVPALAHIAEDLQADYALVSLAIAGYLATTAVIQLIVGPLSDRYGRRPVMLTALVIFIFASLACALAQDVWTFLAFRMLQGGMITGYAVSQAVVRDTQSERDAARMLSFISMAMALAPMLGPVLGGVLDTVFGWRANFYFYIVAGLALLALCWADLGETLNRSQESAGSYLQRIFRVLTMVRFWGYALCGAFSTGAFYIFLAGAPMVAQTRFGVSTAELGIYIGSITCGYMLGSFLSARLTQRVSIAGMMLLGRVVASAGLAAGLILLLIQGHELSPLIYFGSTIFVGLGNGLTLPSCNAGAISVNPRLAGTAAGLNGSFNVANGALLTVLAGIVLAPDNAGALLLILMLLASIAGLFMALLVIRGSPGTTVD